MTRTLLPLILCLGACKPPPDAPEELEELCSYLYANLPSEDPLALQVGVDNLVVWLDANLEETAEGYTVENLTQASLDALEPPDAGDPRDATALVGAAVSSGADHQLVPVVRALLLEEQTEIYPDQLELWEPTFRDDPECFVGQDCEQVLVDNHSITKLPLGLSLTADNTAQYRWVEAEVGKVLVSRSWLRAPATSRPELFRVQAQYFLSVTYKRDGQDLVRLKAVWADAELIGLDVPDATALNMLVGTLQDQDEALYVWMDEQP